MEYIAKIIQEQRSENKRFWKYTFVDTKIGQEDCFLNNYPLNYIPSLVYKLNLLLSDNQQIKFFQSLEQEVVNSVEETQKEQALTQLVGKTTQTLVNLNNDSSRKEKLKLSPQKIDELEKKGLTQKAISDIAGYTDRTIRNWKKLNNKPKQKVGRKSKIIMNIPNLLHFYLLKNPISTQRETANYLHKQTGQLFSQPTISRAIKKIGFTHKVIPYRYSEQIPLLPKVWEFVEENKPLLQTPFLLATDESGFPLNLATRHGYAPKGQKVLAHKPGNRGANYSLILLIQNIDKGGVIHWELIKGAVDTEIFHNFLLNIKLPSAEKYYLLLDNIRFHHANKTKEILNVKNIEPRYLVPYFPQLNPTELLFNVIKQYVRKHRPRTEEELRKNITEIITKLQKEDLTKFFKDCLNYFD